MNTKMLCRIINVRGTWWIEYKVKKHKIGNCKVKKKSFSCFNNKMYILNNGCDGLTLDY